MTANIKRRKAPCVDLKTDVYKDPAFEVLAELAGLVNKYEAIGRIGALWAWCRDRGLKDAIDGCDRYVVSEALVRRFLGADGVRAILADDCTELALGDRRGDLIELRGTEKYVTYLRSQSATASNGGKARAEGARSESGRFCNENYNHPAGPGVSCIAEPAGIHPTPASSSSSSSSSDQRERSTRTRERAPEVGAVARAIWNHASQKHSELKAKGIDRTAPTWPAMPDASNTGWLDLLSRVEELLARGSPDEAIAVGKNRVDVARAAAERDGSFRWFIPATLFTPKSFAIGAARTPEHEAAPKSQPPWKKPEPPPRLIPGAKPRSGIPVEP